MHDFIKSIFFRKNSEILIRLPWYTKSYIAIVCETRITNADNIISVVTEPVAMLEAYTYSPHVTIGSIVIRAFLTI